MSNINRMDKPNSIDLSMGTDGATVGVDHQVRPNIAVGADVGSSRGQATIGAHVTTQLFPEKKFTPFATLGVNLGLGGTQGFNPNADLKAGASYMFDSGFQVGAFVGVDRTFGGSGSSPWGAEAGISAAIHF